jgi:DNA-binding response OmpR family regulator
VRRYGGVNKSSCNLRHRPGRETGLYGEADVRILLVEDDDRVANAQQSVLTRHGFQVIRASTAREVLDRLGPDAAGFDVILLDLGLPDSDGMLLCRQIRRLSDVPIVISSALSDVRSRIHGLHIGADDYLVKPYDLRELIARLHAVVRRRQVPPAGRSSSEVHAPGAAGASDPGEDTRLATASVQVDLVSRLVTVAGREVPLTTKEFDLVALLLRAPGVVFTREQIVAEVWGDRRAAKDHTLDVHVASVRRKTGTPELIETVRGVGYRLGSAGLTQTPRTRRT